MNSAQETLDYYAHHYLTVVAPDAVVKSTLMGYRSVYNAHWRRFGHRQLNTIKPSEFKQYLAETGLARKTRRHVVSVLRLIYDEALADGVIETNPIARWRIRKDKQAEHYEADPYSAMERDKLLNWLACNNEIAWRYFLHGFYTGMRTGELLGFPWKYYEPPYTRVSQEMVRRDIRHYNKTDKRRDLLVPQIVQDMLAANPTRAKGGLVHLTPTGLMFKDADWLMKWWRQAHRAVGIRQRTVPYPWRATFISQCISSGVDMQDVARWVGNSPEMIRKHYYTYLPRDAREQILLKQIEKAVE
jgi:integrase